MDTIRWVPGVVTEKQGKKVKSNGLKIANLLMEEGRLVCVK
jgi:hypothetical protein